MTQQQNQQQPQTAPEAHYFDDYDYEEDFDCYLDYDDFRAGGCGGGGGGGGSSKKATKRQKQRGGGGSGTIYSAKHIRAKESLRLNRK